MSAILDIVAVVIILLGVLLGFWRGLVKQLLCVVLTVAVIAIVYFIAKDTAVDYFKYSLIYDLTNGSGIQIKVEELETTFKIMTLEDLFVVLQNFDGDLQTSFLKLSCDATCRYAVLICSIIVGQIISDILFEILYYSAFRFLVPQNDEGKRKPSFLMRVFGAIFGLVEAAIVIYLFILCVAPLTEIFDNLLPLYQKIVEKGIVANNESVVNALKNIGQYIVLENSAINRAIISLSTLLGLNPYEFIKFTFEGTTYTVGSSLEKILNSAIEILDNLQIESGSATKSVQNLGILSYNLSGNELSPF